MKRIILIVALLGTSNLFAQTQSDSLLVKQIPAIQKTIEKQKQEIDGLTSKVNSQQTTINQQQISINDLNGKSVSLENTVDSLSSLIETNRSNINTIADDLGTKIKETGQQAETRISELGGDVEKNRLYWIIATLVTLLLGALMYLFLGKRIKSSQTDVETQIRNTKKSLEEESLKLDSELIKVFQKQLEVLENSPKGSSQDDDHSLVLKIADRLTAMETNLYRMDPNTRGLNNLKNLVKSTKENFNAKEYEIVEMLGKEYKEGMEVIATFITSDEIEIGKQIITRVIKPQVNFKGQKIQAAQIEVSIGE
jgi:translation initiation factor 2B subunit (eIF-2B alpha/beta/delta family)